MAARDGTLFSFGISKCTAEEGARRRKLVSKQLAKELAEAEAKRSAERELAERSKRKPGRPRKTFTVYNVLFSPSAQHSADQVATRPRRRPLVRSAEGRSSEERLGVAPALLPEDHPIVLDDEEEAEGVNDN